MTDWFAITRRNARSVQTTVGWIFWDPGATGRYVALGLPTDFAEPLGYIAARCAPLAGAGPDAVIAAFGRHPHRNAILGRNSSPEEAEYLARGAFPHQSDMRKLVRDDP